MSSLYINIPNYGSGSWKDPVPTATMLPMIGNYQGDVRVTLDTDFIYIWSGNSWSIGTAATGVSAINGVGGAVTLVAGSGIAINPGSPDGQSITIASTNAGVVTNVTATSPLFSSGGATPNITIQQATTLQSGYLSSADWNTFNNKQPAGSYITALTSDVTASGPGSVAATVNSVGGSSASDIHSAELAANAATATNTADTIVKRDNAGSFSTQKIDTIEGITASSGSYEGILDSQNVKLTDNTAIIRSHLTLGRLDLRDSSNTTGTIRQDGGDLNFTTTGDLKFDNKKLRQIASGTAYNDAVSVGQLSNVKFIHVSPSGYNLTADGSIALPYQTIAAAIAAAPANSTFILSPGAYTEPTVVLPDQITIIGGGQADTSVNNGFSYIATNTNTSIELAFMNAGTVSIDASLSLNGTIVVRSAGIVINRTDSNASVFESISESNIFGANIQGGTVDINECLVINTLTISGGFVIIENSKIIQRIEAEGTATIRMLDCELFGPSEFINGGAGTPTVQMDVTTDALGGYVGTVNFVLLENIPVLNKVLTGYVVGANTPLAATDTILGAFEKVQEQLNNKESLLGFTPENAANKSTDGTMAANSAVLYPSQSAVVTYVASQISNITTNIDGGGALASYTTPQVINGGTP